MKRSFDDPGKVDENWEAPKSRSADNRTRRSFDDPGKADEKLGSAEEEVG